MAGLALAVGVVLAVVQFVLGNYVPGVILFVLCVAWAASWSPLVFPRSVTAVEARRRAARDGRPVIFWRPGCQYCQRLRMRLGRAGRRAHWVNIWADPAGAAAVRAITGGNETVPTVEVDGAGHVNPDPAWVRERLVGGAAGA
ncbi:membrane protein [Asanoa siamensis]|uniref:Membrane protein n=1 Tax=Asanoa siamensis TaxID=926357 RepID=A0ABQ4CM88_9ACTN|nr:membrane protein [Asanoa siamensis]